MNIIRTTAVELSSIPAIAYKLKLHAGGAGVKIHRLDQETTAYAPLDKRSGEAILPEKEDPAFPYEAFSEAVELLTGLPYSSRGKLVIKAVEQAEPDEVAETQAERIDMVDSPEYQAIVERYSDEKGKLNYRLMNKDMIQFAAKSKVVNTMVAEKAAVEDIVRFVVSSRAALIAEKKDGLDETHAQALIETLDEIDPRSAFKELNAHIKRMLQKK